MININNVIFARRAVMARLHCTSYTQLTCGNNLLPRVVVFVYKELLLLLSYLLLLLVFLFLSAYYIVIDTGLNGREVGEREWRVRDKRSSASP